MLCCYTSHIHIAYPSTAGCNTKAIGHFDQTLPLACESGLQSKKIIVASVKFTLHVTLCTCDLCSPQLDVPLPFSPPSFLLLTMCKNGGIMAWSILSSKKYVYLGIQRIHSAWRLRCVAIGPGDQSSGLCCHSL